MDVRLELFLFPYRVWEPFLVCEGFWNAFLKTVRWTGCLIGRHSSCLDKPWEGNCCITLPSLPLAAVSKRKCWVYWGRTYCKFTSYLHPLFLLIMDSQLNIYKPSSVTELERVDLKNEKYPGNVTDLPACQPIKNGAECIWRRQMMNPWVRLTKGHKEIGSSVN